MDQNDILFMPHACYQVVNIIMLNWRTTNDHTNADELSRLPVETQEEKKNPLFLTLSKWKPYQLLL